MKLDGPVSHPLTHTKIFAADDVEAYHSANLTKLSEALLEVLPPQENVALVVEMAGPIPLIFHQLLHIRSRGLHADAGEVE